MPSRLLPRATTAAALACALGLVLPTAAAAAADRGQGSGQGSGASPSKGHGPAETQTLIVAPQEDPELPPTPERVDENDDAVDLPATTPCLPSIEGPHFSALGLTAPPRVPDSSMTAVDDLLTMAAGQATAEFDVLANDLGSPTLQSPQTIPTAKGGCATATVAADVISDFGPVFPNFRKVIQYTPAPGFTGVDTFQYSLSNGSTATATVTVAAPTLPEDLTPPPVLEETDPEGPVLPDEDLDLPDEDLDGPVLPDEDLDGTDLPEIVTPDPGDTPTVDLPVVVDAPTTDTPATDNPVVELPEAPAPDAAPPAPVDPAPVDLDPAPVDLVPAPVAPAPVAPAPVVVPAPPAAAPAPVIEAPVSEAPAAPPVQETEAPVVVTPPSIPAAAPEGADLPVSAPAPVVPTVAAPAHQASTSGRAVRLAGTARPGSTVVLHGYTRPSTTYGVVATTTASPSGTWSFAVDPSGSSRYHVVADEQQTRSFVVQVRQRTSLVVQDAGTRTLEFSGVVRAARPDQEVRVYRATPRGPVHVGTTRTEEDGSWSYRRTFVGTGTFSFAAVLPGGTDNLTATSPARRARVS